MEAKSIGKNLMYHRKLNGYSQEKLADKTGVNIRTIQRIEKDEVSPHPETVQLLATGLEIKVEDILVLQNPKEETIQMKWLLIMHGLPVLGLVIPLFNVLAPIFLWIHKREDSPVYNRHGRAIINFQITITLIFISAFIALLIVEGYGALIFIAVIPFALITMLVNIFLILRGRNYFYPISIPFLSNGKSNTTTIKMFMVILTMTFVKNICQSQSNTTITRLDGSKISASELSAKIRQLIKDANVHGLAVTVFENNQISFQKTFGYADFERKIVLTDTSNIYGASISKAVFGVLVMKLIEEKVIDLDTPLESYLTKKIYEYPQLTKWHDDYSDLKADTSYHKITARMCLAHTCGFPNWRWFESDHTLRTLFEPGDHYSYSGEGLVYLQVVLERMLGKSLESLAREKIFEPLSMRKTSYQWHDKFNQDIAFGHNSTGERYEKDKDNEPRSASTLESTSHDLSIFMEAVLLKKILSKTSWNELMKTQIRIRSASQFGPFSKIQTTENDHIKLGYGLGWGVLHSPHGIAIFKEGHGDGFQHYCILYPEAGIGVMILSNSDNAESIFKELLEVTIGDVYTPWKWEGYLPFNPD